MPKKHTIPYEKMELIKTVIPDSPLRGIEDLMVFDARCLDKQTRQALVSFLSELTRIRKAWKAHFAAFGCLSCKRKKVDYGAGGLCYRCLARTSHRMRACFWQVLDDGRNIPDEIAALNRRFEAAQRLFNEGDE